MYKFKNKLKRCIASILAVLTFATCLSIGGVAYAEDLVAINETNFPDKNFRTIISEIYDVNSNGYLEASERTNTMMTVSGYLEEICGADAKIETLKGIEYFYNLSKLYCAGIGLKELDVHLNTKLTRITCMGNELTSINLGTLNELTYLDCSVNNITALDISGTPNIETLLCNSNAIASIDVSPLANLTTLYINQNELTELNLSSNEKLTNLACTFNHIKELDLSKNTLLVDITEKMIGDQWITQDAYINSNRIYINYVFKNPYNLVSSSLDVKSEGEEGEVTTSAYNGSAFVTDELTGIAGKLVDADGESRDGFVYKYNVNNAACDDMSVNIEVKRNFYQVDFYLDETKEVRLSYNLVISGNQATAPQIPEASTCKEFVKWSENYTNVTRDMSVYIVWRDNHDIVKSFNDSTGIINIYCTKCDEKTVRFDFGAAYNKKTGEDGFDAVGDVNNDGVINAKDYAILYRM